MNIGKRVFMWLRQRSSETIDTFLIFIRLSLYTFCTGGFALCFSSNEGSIGYAGLLVRVLFKRGGTGRGGAGLGWAGLGWAGRGGAGRGGAGRGGAGRGGAGRGGAGRGGAGRGGAGRGGAGRGGAM